MNKKWWIGLTLAAVLLAFTIPIAAGAVTGMLTPDDVHSEPTMSGAEVPVASGETSAGLEYHFTAYDSDSGLCVNFRYSGTPEMESSGSCGFGLTGEQNSPGDEALSIIYEGSPEGPTFLYGPTTPDVDLVAVVLNNGEVLTLPTKPGPPDLDTEFNFYETTIPNGTDAISVAAKDSQNATLGKLDIEPLPSLEDIHKADSHDDSEHAH
jgi:hypothetical protein